MLTFGVLEKLSRDLAIALEQLKGVAVMAQYLPEDEHNAALIATIQETAAIAQQVRQELLALLQSILADRVRNDPKLPAA